ncbi:MAG: HAMP domain-containing protein, partial [Myxococcales bacterium]|nr:HAMP domain-containing protein [Myxococcales bacterium]
MVRNDEVGDLTQDFNVLLSSLEQLAEAAQAVGRGDLSVSIDGEGDLARAFTRMVEQLRSLLLQLRVTASSVADAAAEIQAAT